MNHQKETRTIEVPWCRVDGQIKEALALQGVRCPPQCEKIVARHAPEGSRKTICFLMDGDDTVKALMFRGLSGTVIVRLSLT